MEDFVIVEEEQTVEMEREAEEKVELDLLFLCDSTGSMGSYILAAQENISSIVTRVAQEYGTENQASIKFGLVAYRDHPPQETSFVTNVFDFSESLSEMKKAVDSMRASGGGDGPEAVTAALKAATSVQWRKKSTKVAVIIADAPPHGLEATGDGFPNGDPDGHDPFALVKELADIGVVLYSVCCEPTLSSSYQFARDFFIKIAEMTGGQAIALNSAKLLADIIVHGSCEELTLNKFVIDVQAEVEKQRTLLGASATEEHVYQSATNELVSKGYRTKHMRHNGSCAYTPDTADIWKKTDRPDKKTSVFTSLFATKAALLEKSAPTKPTRAPVPKYKKSSTSFGGLFTRTPAVRGATKSIPSGGTGFADSFSDDSSRCAETARAMPFAPAAAQPAYSTTSKCEDDVISYEQVARLATRSKRTTSA